MIERAKVWVDWTKTWVVIAAFNEEDRLPAVIEELCSAGFKNIVVVDDGSSDNTFGVAQEHEVLVLKHDVNQGQGAALRTGIQRALKEGAEIMVTFDADGQHCVEDLSALIEPVSTGVVDLTWGSRFLGKKSNVPFLRGLILRGGALILRILYGVKLTDPHNGLRALSRHAAVSIKITEDRMEHASEIIEEVGKKKLSYREIPITVKYTKETLARGQKNSNAFPILWKMVKKKLFGSKN